MSSSPLPRSQYRVRLDGLVLNCIAQGNGPAVLLLHGWPQTHHAWRHVLPELAGRYAVVAPDLPGFGHSSKPLAGYDKRTVSAQLRGLMHAQGHERYHVVGHDLGGQVAYALAAQWPDEVRSLTFIEAGVPGLANKEDAANPLKGGSWHFGFNMLPDLPEMLVTGREREYLRFLLFRDNIGVYATEAITDADIDIYAHALRQPGGLRGSFGHYRTLLQDIEDNRAWAEAQSLTMPVLVVGGRFGIGLRWLDTVEAAARHVETEIIDAAGHYVPEEQPRALLTTLRRFLARATDGHATAGEMQ